MTFWFVFHERIISASRDSSFSVVFRMTKFFLELAGYCSRGTHLKRGSLMAVCALSVHPHKIYFQKKIDEYSTEKKISLSTLCQAYKAKRYGHAM